MASRSFILPDEKQIFSRIAGGDEAAFATMFYHYTARIHPFIQKMTRSRQATEEIVQDVFVAIWKKRGELMQIENYQAWVFTIASNLTYNYLKSRARQLNLQQAIALQKDEITNNTLERMDLRESQELVNQVIEQLPPQRKLIFKMSREQGLNHEQIATELNISKNTVKNQMVEALKFIKDKLQKTPGASLTLIAVFLKIHS